MCPCMYEIGGKSKARETACHEQRLRSLDDKSWRTDQFGFVYPAGSMLKPSLVLVARNRPLDTQGAITEEKSRLETMS